MITISLLVATGFALTAVLYVLVDLSIDGSAIQLQAEGGLTRSLARWSAVIVVVFVSTASAVSWLLLRRVLGALETATAAARNIGADNLDARIPIEGPHDEVRVLGETINAMLDRLAEALESQRRFVANASHELRTPLATARTALDVPLTQGRVPAELEPALRRAVTANERSTRILDSLLTLARTQGQGLGVRVPVDLGALLAAAVRERAEAADAAQIALTVHETETIVLGDEQMLAQVCANLIDNAIVHNRHGGHALAWAGVQDLDGQMRPVVEVTNDGQALLPATVETLKEPFHRGTATRIQAPPTAATTGSGLGLGLAIIDEIVTLHQGRLTLTARPEGGLTARIELPASHPGPRPAEKDRS
ncbi:sensor histidine kinase [Cellulosimicrobium cellulans]|uniref:HAMP domain-containing sensor histidine kinase n=1 Tax=Cellulosimicrobium cellulans TaxID=1710 RepID=UPI001652255F|nr:HAMP domain-containing sensor histidine kinase [Cellulosimicrobium cellulans]